MDVHVGCWVADVWCVLRNQACCFCCKWNHTCWSKHRCRKLQMAFQSKAWLFETLHFSNWNPSLTIFAAMEPFQKKRKGGVQQRIAARKLEEEIAQPALDSELGKWLKQEWAWGRFSPQILQKIASLAIADMAACGLERPPQDLQKLAAMGTFGAHQNNIHGAPCSLFSYECTSHCKNVWCFEMFDAQEILLFRKLVTFYRNHCLVLRIWWSTSRVYQCSLNLKRWYFHWRLLLVLLSNASCSPTCSFIPCFQSTKAYWETTFLPGGVKRLKAFWSKIATHPMMDGHCLKSKEFWLSLERCVVGILLLLWLWWLWINIFWILFIVVKTYIYIHLRWAMKPKQFHWHSLEMECHALAVVRFGARWCKDIFGHRFWAGGPQKQDLFFSVGELLGFSHIEKCFQADISLHCVHHGIFHPGIWANIASWARGNFAEILFDPSMELYSPHGREIPHEGLGWQGATLCTFGNFSILWDCFWFFVGHGKVVVATREAHVTKVRFEPGSLHSFMAGELIADGWCGALVFVQGDLDFFAASLQLPRWNTLSGGCPVCKSTYSGPTTWMKFDSPHHIIAMEWKPNLWRAWENRSKCNIFRIPGLTGSSICLDWLHCHYLGAAQYIFGSIFWLLVYHLLPSDPQSNLLAIWARMQQLYKVYRVEHCYSYFNRLSMFVRKSGAPKLRGRGAEVKGLSSIMVRLWQEHCNPAISIHQQILCLLKQNYRMESLLDEHKEDLAFPAASAQAFKDACHSMLHLNHLLFHRFLEEPGCPKLFNTTYKHHMMLHLANHCHELNPRLIWNFTGEDSMKLLKCCVKGLASSAVVEKLLVHWRYAMHFELQKNQWEKSNCLVLTWCFGNSYSFVDCKTFLLMKHVGYQRFCFYSCILLLTFCSCQLHVYWCFFHNFPWGTYLNH